MLRSFLIGGIGYPLLEILWRRRTHPSMILAGGAAMALIHRVNRLHERFSCKVLRCTAGITAIEALCGLIFNRRYQVWDYRRTPGNWRGQICLPYMALWGMLSAAALRLDSFLYQRLHFF